MYRNKHGASNSTMLCHGDHIKTNVCRYHIHMYNELLIQSNSIMKESST